MPAWLAPLLITGAGMAANYFSARSAEKFAERMSSTAHQREVKDMMAAGINPMMSGRGSGASSPQGVNPELGEGASKGLASALAIKQAQAQIKLTEAQAELATDSAHYTRTQRADLETQANSGRYQIIAQQVESGRLDIEQKRQLMPVLLQRAKEEISLTRNSAAAAKAAAFLDEMAARGAINEAEFQKMVGNAGPWMKLLFQLLRRGGAR